MKYAEQRMWQTQTDAFISEDETEVVLNRPTADSARNDQAGGRLPLGTAGDYNPLPAQRCRIIPARSRSTSLTYQTPVGEVIESRDRVLIGMPDMDIQRNDWFTWQGRSFSVVWVDTDRTYQTKAQLELLGVGPRETT